MTAARAPSAMVGVRAIPGDGLTWSRAGRDWPHASASRFVLTPSVEWHVQRLGRGPRLLLLHGTGASTHSFSGLVDCLAPHCELLLPDLPGHAFSRCRAEFIPTLEGSARAVAELCRALDYAPAAIVGHSAGAAIGLAMAVERLAAPVLVVSLNGALLPFGGGAARVLAPLARGLALSPWVQQWCARQAARPGVIERLLDSTGSHLDADGVAWYRRLAASSTHVGAALAMMARWNLAGFVDRCAGLRARIELVAAEADRMIPPDQAEQVAARLPNARLHRLPGLGHLAHEEAPRLVAHLILELAAAAGLDVEVPR